MSNGRRKHESPLDPITALMVENLHLRREREMWRTEGMDRTAGKLGGESGRSYRAASIAASQPERDSMDVLAKEIAERKRTL